jgi:hypothetical protein
MPCIVCNALLFGDSEVDEFCIEDIESPLFDVAPCVENAFAIYLFLFIVNYNTILCFAETG